MSGEADGRQLLTGTGVARRKMSTYCCHILPICWLSLVAKRLARLSAIFIKDNSLYWLPFDDGGNILDSMDGYRNTSWIFQMHL